MESKLNIQAAEFESLKAKYRHIYVIDITIDEGESYQFVVRRPSRELLSAVAATDSVDKANDLIIKNMIVAGDTDALDDGLVFSALMKEIGTFMKSAQAFFKKA